MPSGVISFYNLFLTFLHNLIGEDTNRTLRWLLILFIFLSFITLFLFSLAVYYRNRRELLKFELCCQPAIILAGITFCVGLLRRILCVYWRGNIPFVIVVITMIILFSTAFLLLILRTIRILMEFKPRGVDKKIELRFIAYAITIIQERFLESFLDKYFFDIAFYFFLFALIVSLIFNPLLFFNLYAPILISIFFVVWNIFIITDMYNLLWAPKDKLHFDAFYSKLEAIGITKYFILKMGSGTEEFTSAPSGGDTSGKKKPEPSFFRQHFYQVRSLIYKHPYRTFTFGCGILGAVFYEMSEVNRQHSQFQHDKAIEVLRHENTMLEHDRLEKILAPHKDFLNKLENTPKDK